MATIGLLEKDILGFSFKELMMTRKRNGKGGGTFTIIIKGTM